MGNSPLLAANRRDGHNLRSYSPRASSSQHLRLRSYPSFDMSLEDLHPYPLLHHPDHQGIRWLRSEERDLEDSTVLGVEVDPDMV